MKCKLQCATGLVTLSLILPSAADIIYGSLQQIIPTDYTGVTINVGDGMFNPFFGGVDVANNNNLQPFRMAATGLSTIVDFSTGVFINSGSGSLATGAGASLDQLGTQFTDGTQGYVGFKLDAANYGWIRVVFTNNTSTPVTPRIMDWAYDNTGAAIKTGWINTDIVSGTAQTITLNPATSESFTLGSVLANASGSITNSVVKTGAGTTVLTAANTYTGTTTVQNGTLALGINNAISGNSAVTLGDATTTGTLNMGAFTNSIGSLTFGAAGGTLKLAANQTSSAQLAASGSVVLGSGNTLDLSGMGTSAGLYKLVSGSSVSGTFGTVTGLDSAYTLKYGTLNANEIDAQHKATAVLELGSNASNVRVGSQTVNLSIGNTAPSGSTDLSYTLGGVTGTGTRVAGAGSSAATGTYTAVAGVNSFNITATDANATNSPQAVAFSQTGYNVAAPNTITSSVSLGKVRVGGTFGNSTLTISNTAAAGSYTEGLNAAVSSTTGAATASGSFSNLAGGSSSTALSVGLGIANTSGIQSGNVVIGLESNGTNSGLTALGLNSQTIEVSGGVYDFADAAFSKTAGAGALSGSGTSYTLDFGTGLALNTSYTATFQLANLLLSGNGYQDNLGGSYALTGASQFATTASSFSGLDAGGTNSFTVTFFTGTTGSFSGGLALAGLSQQPGLSDAALATINIAIAGVAIPETSAALLGGLGMLTLLRRRR
jgi:autotransporter-associated beta strand protein